MESFTSGVPEPRKAPDVMVGARDIDSIVGHLFIDGTTDTTQLRKLVEGQMDRIEIELTSALVDCFDCISKFKSLADTQLPAKCTLDTLEDLLKTLQPNLLLIMDRRSFGHFIHFVGGLRSTYLCLLEAFNVIIRIIHWHQDRVKPLIKSHRSLTNVLQSSAAWNWVKGKREQPTVNEDGSHVTKIRHASTKNMLSGKTPYGALHCPNDEQIKISHANGELFKSQLESTLVILKHVSDRLRVLEGFWEPAESTFASHAMKFVPFKLVSELYEPHKDLDPSEISGKYHFGFTYARSLVEYSKKLKAMYCAVAEAQSWKDSKILSSTWFYSAAARYFLAPELASSYYEDVRRTLSLEVQRNVWNLMEDPVIEFFATALGLNPRKIDLPVETLISLESTIVPITIEQLDKNGNVNEKSDLDRIADNQYFSQYYSKSLFVSCHFLFSREVEIDNRLYPMISEEEHNYSKTFSLNTLRSLFEKPKTSGSDPTLSNQRSAVNIKDVGQKLSKLSTTSKGYSTITDNPKKKSDSSMYSDRPDKFERKRGNFLDQGPNQEVNGVFGDEFMEVDIHQEPLEPKPRVGKILDLDFGVVEEDNNNLDEDIIAPGDKKFAGIKISFSPQSSPLKEYSPVVILHIHGGGWISQSPKTHLAYLRMWAKQTNLPILSVDYGLSPENEFPGALNECFAAYKWLLNPENAQALGIPALELSPRIILAGDSAGGNLCCSLTTRIIQENLQKPIGILLSYPVVMMSAAASISRIVFAQDPVLNFQSMQIVLGSYLGARTDLAGSEPLISPAILPDDILQQFPQTVIMVGDTDPIIDDSTFFFQRLREVGVPTKLQIYRRLPHGYLNLPSQLPNAPRAISDAAKFITMLMHDDNKQRGFTVF